MNKEIIKTLLVTTLILGLVGCSEESNAPTSSTQPTPVTVTPEDASEPDEEPDEEPEVATEPGEEPEVATEPEEVETVGYSEEVLNYLTQLSSIYKGALTEIEVRTNAGGDTDSYGAFVIEIKEAIDSLTVPELTMPEKITVGLVGLSIELYVVESGAILDGRGDLEYLEFLRNDIEPVMYAPETGLTLN